MNHENFSASHIGEYLQKYSKALGEALGQVDQKSLAAAFAELKATMARGGHIYVAGNGGSASISDHLCCDFAKGTYLPNQPALKTHSLSANSALLTAIGNDMGFENIFSHQLKILGKKGDTIIFISSSGDSRNIINAAKAAREMNISTIGLTGFSGGEVKPWLDVHLYVPANNYGIVEDSHQALMHVISQFINVERGKTAAQ